jgi:hypothetical protein
MLAEFVDDHGGVTGRNIRFGKKWRKEAPCLDQLQFSCTQRVVVAISTQAQQRNCKPEDVIQEWEILYKLYYAKSRKLSSAVKFEIMSRLESYEN